MKKSFAAALCLPLLVGLMLPARAETVRTGRWTEIRLTHCTTNGDYGKIGDPLVSLGGEGFDTVVFRWENRAVGEYGDSDYELMAENEGGISPDIGAEFTFPAVPGRGERNEWGEYLVSLTGRTENGETGFRLSLPPLLPYRPWTAGGDNTPPTVTIAPVADRLLVTVTDDEGLLFIGDSLEQYEAGAVTQVGGKHDGISYGGRKNVSWVSDSILWNGEWSYSLYACDRAGNMTVRTVFLQTTGLEDIPDAVLNAPAADPHFTSPNTADSSLFTAAAGICAALAWLSFRKARSHTGSR